MVISNTYLFEDEDGAPYHKEVQRLARDVLLRMSGCPDPKCYACEANLASVTKLLHALGKMTTEAEAADAANWRSRAEEADARLRVLEAGQSAVPASAGPRAPDVQHGFFPCEWPNEHICRTCGKVKIGHHCTHACLEKGEPDPDCLLHAPSPAATGERDRVAREGEVWAIIRRACRDVAALPGMMTTTELEARIDAYAAQAESAVLATLGRDAPGERERLRQALAKAAIPLEVLVADEAQNGEHPHISPSLRASIHEAVKAVRVAIGAASGDTEGAT